ncbi:SIS domain-containing protein [Xenorhabdus sp. KJ12.1]|uniref:SIS domain-containing protein n=1 Tax=Xenorhabdus sp. KJ12.1 TaxID=1851571 RepID=UPI000C056D8F|nr:SIS domain-containing protein [Xenorhabdus sp. KJ12.1]PHM68893.1 tagatose-6-phosphate ketose isomerase [Xenorhabdus sp. KJ12.1]
MTAFFPHSSQWLTEHQAHHTAEEIQHQPRLWRTLYHELQHSRPYWQPFLQQLFIKPDLQIILCGAGSSAFVGKAIAPYLRKIWWSEAKLGGGNKCGPDIQAVASTDIVPAPLQYLDTTKPTLLVSYARSGNSPESIAVIQLADSLLADCHHLILTCNPEGELARYAESRKHVCSLIMPEGANDRSFAMTSSFSCMALATLLLLGERTFDMATQKDALERVAALCETQASGWQPLIQRIIGLGFKRMIALGTAGFAGIAEEGALKMLELTAGRIATRYDSCMGVRHGPKFMIDHDTLVVVMLSADPHCRHYDIDLLNELRRDGLAKQIIVLTSQPHPESLEILADLPDSWLIFPYLLFFQLLGFETSLALGLSPDNPCPTGEVNRVVKGVQIYPYTRSDYT